QSPRQVLSPNYRGPRALPCPGTPLASPRRGDRRRAATLVAGDRVSPAPGWRRLLRLTLGDRSIQQDIDDELAFHLAMREEKLRNLGVAPDAARISAHARFGDQAGVRDECLTI